MWEGSVLDSEEGIRFRGKTVSDITYLLAVVSPDVVDSRMPEAFTQGRGWRRTAPRRIVLASPDRRGSYC